MQRTGAALALRKRQQTGERVNDARFAAENHGHRGAHGAGIQGRRQAYSNFTIASNQVQTEVMA
jgi:hypothetical protein